MDTNLITPSGLRKLASELDLLREKREALRGARKTAGAGEFSAELLGANDVARVEQQITVLEQRLASAVVVHPDPADGELDVGELARLRDLDTGELAEYRIVGAREANPAEGSISYMSEGAP